MSSLPTKDLSGLDSIAGLLKDPFGALAKLFSTEYEKESFGVGGEDVFRAVVISQPALIEPSEYKALGYDGDDIQSDRSYKKFKVRIARKTSNPHAVLQDPCDLTKAGDLCHQNALVATHTTVATHQHLGINMGSFIEVRLHRNSNETYNLQTADFVSTLQINETGAKVLNDEFCDSVKGYFVYGDSYSPPPAIIVGSAIRDAADRYDNNKGLPGKSKQKKFLYGNKSPSVKPPFDMWAKALIQLAHEQGFGEVIITSGYRSVAEQQKLYDEYKAGKRKLPAACGTCSRHTNGFAIDLNFYDQNGKFVKSTNPKSDWDGFVAIANSLGLEWGGTYTKYDPVHFQYTPSEWGDDAEMHFETQGYSSNRNYDTQYTGTTRKESWEMDDYATRQGKFSESMQEGEDIPSEILNYEDEVVYATSDSSPYEEQVYESEVDPDE